MRKPFQWAVKPRTMAKQTSNCKYWHVHVLITTEHQTTCCSWDVLSANVFELSNLQQISNRYLWQLSRTIKGSFINIAPLKNLSNITYSTSVWSALTLTILLHNLCRFLEICSRNRIYPSVNGNKTEICTEKAYGLMQTNTRSLMSLNSTSLMNRGNPAKPRW